MYLIILYGFPVLNLIVFYSFVVRAINKIGFIPTYNNPDPNSIKGLETHMRLIYDLGDLMIVSLIAIALGLVFSFFKKGEFFKQLRVHYLISFLLIVANFLGPFNVWFAD